MKLFLAAIVLTILSVPVTAQAPAGAAGAQSNALPLVEGEVRKVDKDQGKITVKHGPIPNIEMPPMTMVFRVKDASMLDQVQAGDKVRFSADKVGGQFTVTSIEISK